MANWQLVKPQRRSVSKRPRLGRAGVVGAKRMLLAASTPHYILLSPGTSALCCVAAEQSGGELRLRTKSGSRVTALRYKDVQRRRRPPKDRRATIPSRIDRRVVKSYPRVICVRVLILHPHLGCMMNHNGKQRYARDTMEYNGLQKNYGRERFLGIQ